MGFSYVIFVSLVVSFVNAQETSLVTLKYGAVQGVRKNVLESSVDVFYAIPYAHSSRFQRPTPWTERYNGTLDATQSNRFCISVPVPSIDRFLPDSIVQEEDCLHLTIWSPNEAINIVALKPVLIYIHGGGFHFDVSRDYRFGDASVLAVSADIVVIAIKYRLGALACLYADEKLMPGNLALEDQFLAFEWIKDNVKYFGGDPDRVTISGHSAGAISSSLHYMVNGDTDLFHQVIMQSGNLGTDVNEDPQIAALRFKIVVNITNCNSPNLPDEIECLREVEPTSLNYAYLNTTWFLVGKNATPSCLVNVGKYSQRKVQKKLWNREFSTKKPILLTNVVDEGSISSLFVQPPPDQDPIEAIRDTIKLMVPNGDTITIAEFMGLYFGGIYANTTLETYRNFMYMIGDRYFRTANLDFGYYAANITKVYSLIFTQTCPVLNKWEPQVFFNQDFGPRHVLDLAYVFGTVMDSADVLPAEDIRVSKQMMSIWSQFVHKGTVDWPSFIYSQEFGFLPFTYEVNAQNYRGNAEIDPRLMYYQYWKPFTHST